MNNFEIAWELSRQDDEVIIEEMDDEHIPSFLLQNSSSAPSEIDGAVCLSNPKSMFEEYLKFMMKESIQRELDEDNGLDIDYKKYMELKKMFEAILPNSSQSESVKLEKATNSKDEASKIDKKIPSLESVSKDASNDSKNESNDPIKAPIIKVNSVEMNTVEKDVPAEENKNDSVENKLPPGHFLIKGNIEIKSISASSSNVSSDSESMNESNFTTPNSSPLFRSKLNKGGKYNKRHAPPPPPVINTSSSGQSDKNEPDENVGDKIIDTVEVTDQVSPIKGTLVLKPGIVKEVDNLSLGKKDVFISHPAVKRRHKPKSRSGKKSNTKHESAINKLINLPSKFAFWKTDDGKSSVSDDNSCSEGEESTGSTSNYEDTSLNNFGSVVDIKVSTENLAEKKSTDNIETGSRLNLKADVIQKVSESEDEPFQDAKETTVTNEDLIKNGSVVEKESNLIDTDTNKNNLNAKESYTRVSTERLVEDSSDYTFIPLRAESLIIHTESRSTDV